MIRTLFLLSFLLFAGNIFCQSYSLYNVQQAFESLPAEPILIRIHNNHKIPLSGHLQGIQIIDSTLIITGSSSAYSYALVSNFDKANNLYKTTRLQMLMHSPFRHAGGCQSSGKNLFLGIEDNIQKDHSKIVSLTTASEKGDSGTVHIIVGRQGIFKRSTAGAVAAVQTKTGTLIAVADWDARNIDFYKQNWNGKFDSVATVFFFDIKGGAYQSINLLADTAGNLFLIGFCKQGSTNRADLFSINDYKPALLSTRFFKCKKNNGFRYGAGVHIKDGKLQLLSCPRKLGKRGFINVFGK